MRINNRTLLGEKMEDSSLVYNAAKIKIRTDSCNNIKNSIDACSSFKIGKTGQKLEDRFKEYENEYDNIEEIYSSSNKTLIDDLEKWLITYFQEYSPGCDNEQNGGGDMDISDMYRIYIVIKN